MSRAQWLTIEARALQQSGLITTKQLSAAGIARAARRWAVAGARLIEVLPGVYRLAMVNDTWRQRATAVLLKHQQAVLSHDTAAWLWGFADSRVPETIHFTTTVTRGHEAPAAWVVHRTRVLPPSWKVRGFDRVTGIARTLIDLAPSLTDLRLEALMDDLQRRWHLLGKWLYETLEELPRNVAARARIEALLTARMGQATDSPLETEFRRLLRVERWPEPVLQHPTFDVHGDFIGLADFAWPARNTLASIDSHRWHSGRAAFDRDADQRSRLNAAGWQVISVTTAALENGSWRANLRAALERYAPQLRLALAAPPVEQGLPPNWR